MEAKVNLFFIGAMRCGSTTINLLLDQHPEIFMSQVKEPRYFEALALQKRALASGLLEDEKAYKSFKSKGKYRDEESYNSLFQAVKDQRYVGESSHYIYAPVVADLIHQYNSNAKFIVSLRDPVDRLFSEYQLLLRRKDIDMDFKTFVKESYEMVDGKVVELPHSRINKGLYTERIKAFTDRFGKEQVKLVLFEDLENNPQKIMQGIFQWLGLATEVKVSSVHTQKSGRMKNVPLLSALLKNRKNKKRLLKFIPKLWKERLRSVLYGFMLKRERIDHESVSFLKKYYAADKKKLQSEFGLDLQHWK